MKAKGIEQKDKMLAATNPLQKLKNLTAAAFLFGVFVAYRAYRGTFVIVPAVYDEVREKVRAGIVDAGVDPMEVQPKTGKLRLRSMLMMNLGAVVFTGILLVRTCFDAAALVLSKLGSGSIKPTTLQDQSENDLDLPPLPDDIPDIAPPDTDELPPSSCCD